MQAYLCCTFGDFNRLLIFAIVVHPSVVHPIRISLTHCLLTSKLSTFQPAFDHERALRWLPSFSLTHHLWSSYADDGNLSFNILSISSKPSLISLWLSGRSRK